MRASLGRILLALNVAIFVCLLAWMAATYASSSSLRSTIVAPSSFELTDATATNDAEPSEWDDIAGAELSGSDRADDHPLQLRGLAAFEAGRIGEAIGLLRAAAAVRPQDASIWNDLGVYLARAGRHEESLPAFLRAVEAKPDEARGQYNLGTAQLRAGHPEAAIPPLYLALAQSPYYSEARYNLAQAFTRTGNVEAAREAYQRVIESNRGRIGATASNNLGILLRRDGKTREALEHFTSALRRIPTLAKARFNKGLALMQLGMKEEARIEYEKLIEVDPSHARAHVNLAALLMRDERWADAATHLRRATQIDPDYARAHYNLGLCQAQLGDDEGAVEALLSALSAEPEYAAAAYNLGLAERRRKEVDSAIRWFSQAAKLAPEAPAYHYNLGLALGDDPARSSDAIDAYEAALALEPGYFKARYNIGLAFYRAARYPEARASFEQAQQLRADSYEAAYNLGLSLLKLGDPIAAEAAFERALELEDSVVAHYNLGLALGRQGLLAGAVTAYQQALSLDPKHAPSIERLAELYISEQDHSTAQTLLERLQLMDPDDPSAYNAGVRAYRSGSFDNAIRYLEVAATGEPSLRVRSLNMIGLAYSNSSRLQQGIDVLAKAVDEFPDNERVRGNLRILRSRMARIKRREATGA